MKKLIACILVLGLFLSGCSSKKKEEVKEPKVTDTKKNETEKPKPETETEKPNEEKLNVIEISDADKQALYNRTQFANEMLVAIRPEFGVPIDFTSENTIDMKFTYLMAAYFRNPDTDPDDEGRTHIPFDTFYNLGLAMFNQEFDGNSGGNFTYFYDGATNSYIVGPTGFGGYGYPQYDLDSIKYSVEAGGVYVVEVPFLEFDEPGENPYKQTGTTYLYYGKSNSDSTNFYYIKVVNEPLK